ncbi:MAG: hypothetical protein KF819_29060 [Labilithrix sp.]|nr:hypothetical protein [Labilithrix sp.]
MSFIHRSLGIAGLVALAAACSTEVAETSTSSQEALAKDSRCGEASGGDATDAPTPVAPAELSFRDVNSASVRVAYTKRWNTPASWKGSFTLVGKNGFTKTATCAAPSIPDAWERGTGYCSAYFDGDATGTITFRYTGSGLTSLSIAPE